DRMLFRGYVPIMSGWQMAQFFSSSGIRFRELIGFLVHNAERVKRHAMIIADQEGRRFEYLQEKVKKEKLAKQIADRDHITEGVICISILEPCRTFFVPDGKRETVRRFRALQVSVRVFLFHPS